MCPCQVSQGHSAAEVMKDLLQRGGEWGGGGGGPSLLTKGSLGVGFLCVVSCTYLACQY
jgi:hypothetical protein